MNNDQQQLVYLISQAIRGKKVGKEPLENQNWNYILRYANSHQVKALIYSAFQNSGCIINLKKEILEQWKKETMLTAVGQMRHIKQVTGVLSNFNDKKIPFIVLKGLVIRELYPRPELRTMSDADILIKQSDLNVTKELMAGLGYSEEGISPMHIFYYKKNCSPIEIHWTIEDYRFFNGNNMNINKMWDDAKKVEIGGVECLSFSNEDLALHLCIHMAAHIITGGFGIRQLCDLVLLVEKEGLTIDWQSFFEKGKKWRIEKFIIAIFLTCNQLFDMNIPSELEQYCNLFDKKQVNLLINEILEGGVYGKKDLANVFSNELAYGAGEQHGGNLAGVIKRFLLFLFPTAEKMSSKYSYAKKYKIFIPLAWFHHMFSGISNAKYGVIDKFSFFKSALYNSIKRYRLLKKLGL